MPASEHCFILVLVSLQTKPKLCVSTVVLTVRVLNDLVVLCWRGWKKKHGSLLSKCQSCICKHRSSGYHVTVRGGLNDRRRHGRWYEGESTVWVDLIKALLLWLVNWVSYCIHTSRWTQHNACKVQHVGQLKHDDDRSNQTYCCKVPEQGEDQCRYCCCKWVMWLLCTLLMKNACFVLCEINQSTEY